MKRLAIGLFLLSFFPSPDGFAQTQEQLVAGAKNEGKLVVSLRQQHHSFRCTSRRSIRNTLS